MKTLCKNERCIQYQIHRKTVKKAYFRVKDGLLQITAHPLVSIKTIEYYIMQHFEKLEHRIQEDLSVESDHEMTLWGKTYDVILTYGQLKYEISEDVIYIQSKLDDIELIRRKVYALELERRLNEINQKVLPVIAKSHVKELPIKLKYLKSKYGSYHRKHQEITLNTFLAKLDPIYLEYVLFHEYAHVLVFNHSKDFYDVLSLWMPKHKEYQKALKKIVIK